MTTMHARKKSSLMLVGVAAAIVTATAVASFGSADSASAAEPAVPSYYASQAECDAALAQSSRDDLVCNKTIGKPTSEAWVLTVLGG